MCTLGCRRDTCVSRYLMQSFMDDTMSRRVQQLAIHAVQILNKFQDSRQ